MKDEPMLVELRFPVLGTAVPLDHGYALYAAVSRAVPALHEGGIVARIGPISGNYMGDGSLALGGRCSFLRIRIAPVDIGACLPLAGKRLELDGNAVRLGVPRVLALTPAASLAASLVTIKKFTEPAPFLEAVGRQLAALGIAAHPAIPLVRSGPHAGSPRRKILRVGGHRVVGFALLVESLTAPHSLLLQSHGLGGRSKMGCGFFVPVKEGGAG